jgi:hypothetical protein
MRVWAVSLFVLHMMLFLFGKQAFCNYYALAAFLLLLCIIFTQTENA